ncbi:hypothetical protein BB558_007111 [Smittium angustum]|uniref:DNA topoisomerase n=1 Tax=Smittium angustum TaxID=133377 RepID=A0A2U1IVV6_SMIAN|nr:hypothetical protein BB558_007111 [Smittium angustum]
MEKMSIRYLKMDSQKTMKVAEQLYNKGFISYPRTETDMFDKTFDLKSLISKQTEDPTWGGFAKKLIEGGGFEWPRNGKNNDKAHPPIHPTSYVSGNMLSSDEKKLYELITRRFLACCSKNAIGYQTTVTAKLNTEFFTTSGLMICEYNYLEIYKYGGTWNEQTIPMYRVGETFKPTRFEITESATTKPSLMDEAELVDIMNKSQIGTDATIHEHIKKIIDREYVVKLTKQPNKDKFLPSNLGFALVDGYDDIGLDLSLSKPYLRREMETLLRNICEGKSTKNEVVDHCISLYKNIYIQTVNQKQKICEAVSKHFGISENSNISRNTSSLNNNGGNINRDISSNNILGKCPICLKNHGVGEIGNAELVQQGKFFYLRCSNYLQKKCDFNSMVTNHVGTIINARALDTTCTNCETRPKLIKFEFSPGSVPPFLPLSYDGCLFGCNQMLNEVLNFSLPKSLESTANIARGQGSSIRQRNGVSNSRNNVINIDNENNSEPETIVISESKPSISRTNIYDDDDDFLYTGNSSKRTSTKSRATPTSTRKLTHQTSSVPKHPTLSIPKTTSSTSKTKKNEQSKLSSKPGKFEIFGGNRPRELFESINDFGDLSKPYNFSSTINESMGNMNKTKTLSFQNQNYNNKTLQRNFQESDGEKGDSVPKCSCGLNCVLRTVKKTGPNEGKKFYACPDGRVGGCNHFEWVENLGGYGGDGNNYSRNGISRNNSTYNGNSFDSFSKDYSNNLALFSDQNDNKPKCECGLYAILHTVGENGSKKSKLSSNPQNIGKKYFKCSKSSFPCKFFKWVDDISSNNNEISRRNNLSKPKFSNNDFKCFVCNKKDHFANECPNRMKNHMF